MARTGDIYKASGILIQNRSLLVTRSKGKETFFSPGGKLQEGETPIVAVMRELNEELSITVEERDLEPFGSFYAPAADDDTRLLHMEVFRVLRWAGEIRPSSEIEEICWVTSHVPEGLRLGSIFAHEVIPRLKREGAID